MLSRLFRCCQRLCPISPEASSIGISLNAYEQSAALSEFETIPSPHCHDGDPLTLRSSAGLFFGRFDGPSSADSVSIPSFDDWCAHYLLSLNDEGGSTSAAYASRPLIPFSEDLSFSYSEISSEIMSNISEILTEIVPISNDEFLTAAFSDVPWLQLVSFVGSFAAVGSVVYARFALKTAEESLKTAEESLKTAEESQKTGRNQTREQGVEMLLSFLQGEGYVIDLSIGDFLVGEVLPREESEFFDLLTSGDVRGLPSSERICFFPGKKDIGKSTYIRQVVNEINQGESRHAILIPFQSRIIDVYESMGLEGWGGTKDALNLYDIVNQAVKQLKAQDENATVIVFVEDLVVRDSGTGHDSVVDEREKIPADFGAHLVVHICSHEDHFRLLNSLSMFLIHLLTSHFLLDMNQFRGTIKAVDEPFPSVCEDTLVSLIGDYLPKTWNYCLSPEMCRELLFAIGPNLKELIAITKQDWSVYDFESEINALDSALREFAMHYLFEQQQQHTLLPHEKHLLSSFTRVDDEVFADVYVEQLKVKDEIELTFDQLEDMKEKLCHVCSFLQVRQTLGANVYRLRRPSVLWLVMCFREHAGLETFWYGETRNEEEVGEVLSEEE